MTLTIIIGGQAKKKNVFYCFSQLYYLFFPP